MQAFSGQLVDIKNRRIFGAKISISGGRIIAITPNGQADGPYILPGFIDAHIHIESSMLVPYEFARVALRHGTVATISDPHEIANVMGIAGVHYMLENAKGAKLKFHFGAPSCVPATTFETAGATIDSSAVEVLLQRDDIYYLTEMMNYPGVLFNDSEVMKKIALAGKYGKPVDGHAPGLRGADAKKYIEAGISTDHECFTLDEALDKIQSGMKILIREGSAARNFDALHTLLGSHPQACMFCCDDKHPDELVLGHINRHVQRAIGLGYNVFDVLFSACVHPVEHYKLNVGLLKIGDAADFIVVDNLIDFTVLKTVIDGETVAEQGKTFLPPRKHEVVNNFHATPKKVIDFFVGAKEGKIRVMEALDGQLITQELHETAKVDNGNIVSDITRDLLKIAVVNRYNNEKTAVAFIKNFGLKRGAIASSVAHDSHNIVVTGTDDESICKAVNLIIDNNGGLSLVDGSTEMVLPLPVAGLMSNLDGETIGDAYTKLDRAVKSMGSGLRAPYMTLSFMALLVIPQLKLSDKGLFDGKLFQFADLFVQ